MPSERSRLTGHAAFDTFKGLLAESSRISVRLRRAPTQYKPVSRIAVGGMAEVWRGTATFEGGDVHPVAIKRVLPNMTDPMFRAMFRDEARLGMELRHPNIVPVYDARDIGGTYIMIMELVDGDSLKGLLDGAHERGAPMPVPVALFIARELAGALAYAHTVKDRSGNPLNIIHRDVSPHNLLLGKTGVVKLTDFGLADASVNDAVAEGMVGGKLGYLAPEIIRQNPGDHRIDLFAVGIMLWEMLAGRRLFQGADDAETIRNVAACEVPPLPALNSRVSSSIDEVVRLALHPDPEQRVQNAGRLYALIDQQLRRIDTKGDVGAGDVKLVMSLHLAMKARAKEKAQSGASLAQSLQDEMDVAELLANELDAFAAAQQGMVVDMGAQPLNPDAFGAAALFSGSGVRPMPKE